MDYDISPEEPEEVVIDSAGFADVGGRRCERGNASLEMLLVLPVLVLLVVFVLWAGRGGRAGLVTDLAAGEAATVAALYSDDPTDSAERERVVEQMLSARPGLDYLCIDGARGRDYNDDDPNDDGGFVDEQWVTFEPELPGHSPGVGVIGVSLECVTDGAVGPTRHLFPTVSFSGHATEVVAVDPRPLLSVVQDSEDEGHGVDGVEAKVLEFLFQLDLPATQAVTIHYYTCPGDPRCPQPDELPDRPDGTDPATAGGDYMAVNSSVVFAPGELSKTVQIPITGETLYELNEILHLVWEFDPLDPCDAPSLDPSVNRLSDDETTDPLTCEPTDPDYWKGVSVGTIRNDDDPPVMTVTSPTASEDVGQMTFTVSLKAATAVPVTFDYQTVPGNPAHGAVATAGVDYTALGPPSRQGNFVADQNGDQSQLIPVTILNELFDPIAEPDEHFFLHITNVMHARPQDIHARPQDPLVGIGTITDDEPTITITSNPNPAEITEGDSLAFIVTATNVASGQDVTVNYTVADGPADADRDAATFGLGGDYTVASPHSNSGTLTFTSNRTTQTITVNTVDDNIDETEYETFTVELSPLSLNARILGDASITGVIEDNDPTPKLQPAVTEVMVREGETFNLDFNLLGRSSFDVEFWLTDRQTADDTDTDADPGDDYSVLPATPTPLDSPLTITALQTGLADPVVIEAKTDPYNDKEEKFELYIDPVLNADADPDTVTVTIEDASPHLFSVADPLDVNEGERLIFTISLNPAIPTGSGSVTVNFTISEPTTGNPAEPEDYNYTGTGSVTFAAGELTKTVEVDTVFDLDYPEGTETLWLTIINLDLLPDEFGSNKPKGTGKILDVEPPELSVSDARAEEGLDLVFVFTLDIPAVFEVAFDVCTYAQRATAGPNAAAGADYSNAIEGPGPIVRP